MLYHVLPRQERYSDRKTFRLYSYISNNRQKYKHEKSPTHVVSRSYWLMLDTTSLVTALLVVKAIMKNPTFANANVFLNTETGIYSGPINFLLKSGTGTILLHKTRRTLPNLASTGIINDITFLDDEDK